MIACILGGGECKMLVDDLQSERHPDLAIYKTLPPSNNAETWQEWIPKLAVEIVSPGSKDRDYHEKREEYWQLGVKEYWIINLLKGDMFVPRRSRGRWREQVVKPGETYTTTLLPGLAFDLAQAFAAVPPTMRGSV